VFRQQRRALRLERVGNVLEKDQAKRDMLVIRRFEVFAQLVGSKEKLRLEPKVGAIPVALLRLRLGGGRVAVSILCPAACAPPVLFSAQHTSNSKQQPRRYD
jgi:hypothetical protein